MTGQVRALNYLKECRGGASFVAEPGLTPRDSAARNLTTPETDGSHDNGWKRQSNAGRRPHDHSHFSARALADLDSGSGRCDRDRGRRHGERRCAARQVVQGRPHPLLRRRRRGRRLRHHRLQRRQAGRRTTPARRSTTSSPAGQSEKMVQQLREAVASQPDGIAMMGHPGDGVDHAARRGSVQGRHHDDVPERDVPDGARQVRRRLCRRAASRRRATRSAPRPCGCRGLKAGRQGDRGRRLVDQENRVDPRSAAPSRRSRRPASRSSR